MSIAETYSAQLVGLQTEVVTIEVDISNGLHNFSVIGLGDRSVEESKDRVSAAIKNSGYISPKQKNQKVVVSLAPADIRKEGPAFDLGIAVAYLAATKDIELVPSGKLFLGELSLEGNIRKVSGVLPMLCQARSLGFVEAFIPKSNIREASLAQGIYIYAVSSLQEVLDHLSGKKVLENIGPLTKNSLLETILETSMRPNTFNMSVVRGNDSAKRGLEIAAAGAHNVIMCGPPGTGKTLLAQSFSSILPPLSYEHSVEVTSIHSAARTLGDGLILDPPFRAPHHTASTISIIGGGALPRPGEITLAHRGVLFMDEFPEFDRAVIEALRQPLEEHEITVSRMKHSITFPAQTILLASMNPCPCGRKKGSGCICNERLISNYWRKISGPIMDRIDIWLKVDEVDYDKIIEKRPQCDQTDSLVTNQTEKIATRIKEVRRIQKDRFHIYHATDHAAKKSPTNNNLSQKYTEPCFNSEMTAEHIEKMVKMTDEARSALLISARKLELSGRAIHRVIKVAQTIADLDWVTTGDREISKKEELGQKDNSAEIVNVEINKTHILEALSYRRKI